MNNLLEKIKATTLRQRLIIGGVFLILIGFGTATIVHHQNVVSEAKNKQEKLESDKKAKLDRHLKADKASKDKADQAAREKAQKDAADKQARDKVQAELAAKVQAENDAKAQAESEKVQADQAAQAVSEPQQQVQPDLQPDDNYSGQSEVPNSPSQSTPSPPVQAPSPGNQWGNTTPAEQGALEKGHSVMGGDESLNVYEK